MADKIKWLLPRVYIRKSVSPYSTPIISMIFLCAFFIGSKLIYYEYLTLGKCGLREEMNMPCPGCGGTRTTIAFFNLDFYQALLFNPLVFTFCLLWTLQAINLSLYKIFRYRVHIKWLYISNETKFVLATFVFLFNWFLVTQLSAYWVE